MGTKRTDGGWEVSISDGVLRLNGPQGALLRITGLPADVHFRHEEAKGVVFQWLAGD